MKKKNNYLLINYVPDMHSKNNSSDFKTVETRNVHRRIIIHKIARVDYTVIQLYIQVYYLS